MRKKNPKVLVIATSRKTRGGITSVVKAHEQGEQWKKFSCKWIETHRDGSNIRKLLYFGIALIQFIIFLPFYDIVHIHVGTDTSVLRKIPFAYVTKMFSKKLIIHFHPSSEIIFSMPRQCVRIKELFQYADLLLALAPQWIKYINEAYPNNNFEIKVLYNPCPKVKRDYSIKKNKILYAGRLNDRKGYNRLLEAFSVIASEHPDWQLVFAGNGEIEKAKQIQDELGIDSKQVSFLGWINGIEKETTFQEASIYCLPSWGEGFPMGVLDAMAYGIPVITTPVGGIMDILENGKHALIYDVNNNSKLAHCLNQLINSEILRNEMVAEADKIVNNEFSIEQISKELSQIYSTL